MKSIIEKLLFQNEYNSENIESIKCALEEACEHYSDSRDVTVEILGSEVEIYGISDPDQLAVIYEYAYSIIRMKYSEVL